MSFEQKCKSILSEFDSVSLSDIAKLNLQRRYDTKFLFSIKKLPFLLRELVGYYKVVEIDKQRHFYYETQYYDTANLECYLAHHNDRKKRFKVRKRHYSVNDISYFEIKQKTNKGKTLKTRKQLSGNTINNEVCNEYINKILHQENDCFIESGSNSFYRITLVSFATKERITLDFNICFSEEGRNYNSNYFVVAEIKREKKYQYTPFYLTLKNLGIRPIRFSKYCIGMALLNPDLKQNTFKNIILKLNKLEND
ncbi:MAG: VTC domain-containing protein [Bacteroidales bacterium]|nr:VTC domain-containing protein [Bacteroidales bacterium]